MEDNADILSRQLSEEQRKTAELSAKVTELTASLETMDKRLRGEIAWAKKHRAETESALAAKAKELAAAKAQITVLQREKSAAARVKTQLERELRVVTAARDKLAKSKLGRLTLAYWRKKDRFLGRFRKAK